MSGSKTVERARRLTAIDGALASYSLAMMGTRERFIPTDAAAAVTAVVPDFTLAELWEVIESRVVHLDMHRNELLQLARHLTSEREGSPDAAGKAMETILGGRPC